MLDDLSDNQSNDATADSTITQQPTLDDSDEELTLWYPESEPESDAELQPIAIPEPLQSTPAPSETAHVPSSPVPLAPVAKALSDSGPSTPSILAPQPPSRPSSSLSSHSDDIPLSQIIPPRPSQPRPSSPPPRKRARLDESHLTPLEFLVAPSGARTLEFDAASNSYHASSQHYSVDKCAISVCKSDGSAAHRPQTDVESYEILSLDDHSNRDWRKKIGELIGGAFFGKANQLPELPDEPIWNLSDFPLGYNLWRRTRVQPTEKNPLNTRSDIYLYGCFGKRFASPAEFAPHAIWLLHGAPAGKCACKYCSKIPQRQLTAKMEDEVIAARTAPSARRSKSFAPPSPVKSAPVNPVKLVLAPTALPAMSLASTAPPRLVADDGEFLRALKRRDDSFDAEETVRRSPAPKLEED